MLLSILFSQLNFDLNSKVFGHYPASLSDLPTFDERRSNDQNFPWILEEVSAKYPMVKLSIASPFVNLLTLSTRVYHFTRARKDATSSLSPTLPISGPRNMYITALRAYGSS